jgi:hypothetical protein
MMMMMMMMMMDPDRLETFKFATSILRVTPSAAQYMM